MIVTDLAAGPLAGLYLTRKPAAELAPGDIVVSVGRALHLREKTGHVLGYDRWAYVTFGPVARAGTVTLCRLSEVNVAGREPGTAGGPERDF